MFGGRGYPLFDDMHGILARLFDNSPLGHRLFAGRFRAFEHRQNLRSLVISVCGRGVDGHCVLFITSYADVVVVLLRLIFKILSNP